MDKESEILEIYKRVQEGKGVSAEYEKERRKSLRLREELENDLEPYQREMLNNLIEQRTIAEEVEMKEYFIEAFKIATRLMTEVFAKDDNNT